jgi:hypothetical protein
VKSGHSFFKYSGCFISITWEELPIRAQIRGSNLELKRIVCQTGDFLQRTMPEDPIIFII